MVTGTTAAFGGSDGVGSTKTVTVSCATGKLLSGGANIANGTNNQAALSSSAPTSNTVWSATATLVLSGSGAKPTITAFALCGS
jgi:hypothetical protein